MPPRRASVPRANLIAVTVPHSKRTVVRLLSGSISITGRSASPSGGSRVRVVSEARRRLFERDEAGCGEHTGLPHSAAQHLSPATRLVYEGSLAEEH